MGVPLRSKSARTLPYSSAASALAKDVLAQNEKSVTDYKNGKTNALGYLVGQCMKASKGKANPGIVKEIVTKMLNA